MGRWQLVATAFVATLALFGGVSAVSGNEPPLAEAGLDQTVDNGTTVYLDAGGSVDPDGTIAGVQWSITDPDGAPVPTADDTSVRTQFTPTQTGNYTANLSVTDDDGATAVDTLYVTVQDPDGPSVTLLGPGQTTRDEPTEFIVSATAGDAPLRQLYWLENDSTERTVDLSGTGSNVTLNRSFPEAGSYRLDATVQDTQGHSQTSSLRLQVLTTSGSGNYEHCPGPGSPYFADGDFIGCNDGGADMIYGDYVLEANDRPGLWLHNDAGELVQMASEEEVERMKDSPNDALTRDEVSQNYELSVEEAFEDLQESISNNIRPPSTDSSDDEGTDSTNDDSANDSPTSSDRTIAGRSSNTGGSCVAPCGQRT